MTNTAGRRSTMALLLGAAAIMASFPVHAADPAVARPHCIQVGGTISTNLGAISETSTLGSAAGDLQGAVAATILEIVPQSAGAIDFLVRHHWVTDTGDTLQFEPAHALAVPVGEGVFGVTYEPVKLAGGTGRYENASGTARIFGAVDLARGETIFRYSGEICFLRPAKP